MLVWPPLFNTVASVSAQHVRAMGNVLHLACPPTLARVCNGQHARTLSRPAYSIFQHSVS